MKKRIISILLILSLNFGLLSTVPYVGATEPYVGATEPQNTELSYSLTDDIDFRMEYPNPEWARTDTWKSLNGTWSFMFDPKEVGIAEQWYASSDNYTMQINVPYCWESPNSGVENTEYRGVAWYQRTLDLRSEQEAWADKQLVLKFGAVDHKCQIWINGTPVEILSDDSNPDPYIHEGGYNAFEANITEHVDLSKVNTITVMAEDKSDYWDDSYSAMVGKQGHNAPCGYTHTSGIWQSVYLEGRESTTSMVYAHADPDIDNASVKFSLKIDSAITQNVLVELDFKSTLYDINTDTTLETGSQFQHRQQIALQSGTQEYSLQTIIIDNQKLWSDQEANLYEGTICLYNEEGVLLDRVSTYFGQRKISADFYNDEVGVKYIYINNNPVFLAGLLDQGYWPEGVYTAPSEDALKYDVVRMKEYGFNMIRKHLKIEDPLQYYWADKVGMYIWQDMPHSTAMCPKNFSDPVENRLTPGRDLYEYALTQMMDDFYNHPSVIAIILFNETWGLSAGYNNNNGNIPAADGLSTFEWVRKMYQTAKNINPMMLVEDMSAVHEDHIQPSDLNTFHVYPNGYTLAKTVFDEYVDNCYIGSNHNYHTDSDSVNDGDPFLNSEYGGVGVTSGDKDVSWCFKFLTDIQRQYDKLNGFVYTETNDIEYERNGFMTYDRRDKAFPYDEIAYGGDMTVADLVGKTYIGLAIDPICVIETGSTYTAPVIMMHWDAQELPKGTVVKWRLDATDKYGQNITTGISGTFSDVVLAPYVQETKTLTFTAPEEECVGTVTVWLEAPDGTKIAKNFVNVIVSDNQAATNTEKLDHDTYVLRKTLVDNLEVDGIGTIELTYKLPDDFDINSLNTIRILAEASSVKGETENNSKFSQTVEGGELPSDVTVSINGVEIDTVYLQDNPRDIRGTLTLLEGIADEKDGQAINRACSGDFGYLLNIKVNSQQIEQIMQTLTDSRVLTVKYEVKADAANPGGVRLYGDTTGRYAVSPCIILNPNDADYDDVAVDGICNLTQSIASRNYHVEAVLPVGMDILARYDGVNGYKLSNTPEGLVLSTLSGTVLSRNEQITGTNRIKFSLFDDHLRVYVNNDPSPVIDVYHIANYHGDVALQSTTAALAQDVTIAPESYASDEQADILQASVDGNWIEQGLPMLSYDNDLTTQWKPTAQTDFANGASIEFTLDRYYDLTAMELAFAERVVYFDVAVSQDGNAYTTVASINAENAQDFYNSQYLCILPELQAEGTKYVKLSFTGTENGQSQISLAEIGIRGKLDIDNPKQLEALISLVESMDKTTLSPESIVSLNKALSNARNAVNSVSAEWVEIAKVNSASASSYFKDLVAGINFPSGTQARHIKMVLTGTTTGSTWIDLREVDFWGVCQGQSQSGSAVITGYDLFGSYASDREHPDEFTVAAPMSYDGNLSTKWNPQVQNYTSNTGIIYDLDALYTLSSAEITFGTRQHYFTLYTTSGYLSDQEQSSIISQAYTQLELAQIGLQEGEATSVLLADLVAEAEQLDLNDYTADSVVAFSSALKQAHAVLGKISGTGVKIAEVNSTNAAQYFTDDAANSTYTATLKLSEGVQAQSVYLKLTGASDPNASGVSIREIILKEGTTSIIPSDYRITGTWKDDRINTPAVGPQNTFDGKNSTLWNPLLTVPGAWTDLGIAYTFDNCQTLEEVQVVFGSRQYYFELYSIDGYATPDEESTAISTAYLELLAAKEALEYKPENIRKLEALLEDVSAMDLSGFSMESADAVRYAVTNAENTLVAEDGQWVKVAQITQENATEYFTNLDAELSLNGEMARSIKLVFTGTENSTTWISLVETALTGQSAWEDAVSSAKIADYQLIGSWVNDREGTHLSAANTFDGNASTIWNPAVTDFKSDTGIIYRLNGFYELDTVQVTFSTRQHYFDLYINAGYFSDKDRNDAIDEAYTRLKNAVEALSVPNTTEELDLLIQQVQSLDMQQYTAQSVTSLEQALANACAVRDDAQMQWERVAVVDSTNAAQYFTDDVSNNTYTATVELSNGIQARHVYLKLTGASEPNASGVSIREIVLTESLNQASGSVTPTSYRITGIWKDDRINTASLGPGNTIDGATSSIWNPLLTAPGAWTDLGIVYTLDGEHTLEDIQVIFGTRRYYFEVYVVDSCITPEEVDSAIANAYAQLRSAKEALQLKPENIRKLEKLLKEVEALDLSDYTKESAGALQTAVDNAQFALAAQNSEWVQVAQVNQNNASEYFTDLQAVLPLNGEMARSIKLVFTGSATGTTWINLAETALTGQRAWENVMSSVTIADYQLIGSWANDREGTHLSAVNSFDGNTSTMWNPAVIDFKSNTGIIYQLDGLYALDTALLTFGTRQYYFALYTNTTYTSDEQRDKALNDAYDALETAVDALKIRPKDLSDFGWQSDCGDFSGWSAVDGENLFTTSSTGIWKKLITDEENFVVTLDVTVGDDSCAYITVQGVTLTITNDEEVSDQLKIKIGELDYKVLYAQGDKVSVGIVRTEGGSLEFSLIGAGGSSPFKATVTAEGGEKLEVGLLQGSMAGFSDVSVTKDGKGQVDVWNLILHNQISASFQMLLSPYIRRDADAYIQVVHNDETMIVSVPDLIANGNKLQVDFAAAQMTDTVTIQVFDGDGNGGIISSYSIRQYADYILHSDVFDEKTKKLVKNMLLYGGASQTYFGYNTDNLASAGITEAVVEPENDDLTAITDGDLNGIKFYGASLLFQDRVGVRFYFTVSEEIEHFSFMVDGVPYIPTQKDGLYYIQVMDISPYQLADQITVIVNDSLSVCYSPLVYIQRMYHKNSSSQSLKDVVMMLYNYYLAAVEYVGDPL